MGTALSRLAACLLPALLAGCLAPPGLPPAPDGVASASSPIALSQDGRWLWVVNPDHDSVTRIDTTSSRADAPIAVGREPWAVAVTPDGQAVVLNRRDGSLTRVGGAAGDIAVGPEPGGLALSPSGRYAYVTLSSDAEVVRIDLEQGLIDARVAVGPQPWAIAVGDDGDLDDDDETVVVTHRFARPRDAHLHPVDGPVDDDGHEGWLTRLSAELEPAGETALAHYTFGFPNVLEGLALQGGDAWVAHQLNAPELPRDFETTVSAGLTRIGLGGEREPPSGVQSRLHLNEPSFSTPINFPRALAISADGARAYVALAGSDAVMTVDVLAPGGPRLVGFWPTGNNPRGMVLSPDGRRGYVMNFLSRDVSVLDLADEAGRRELERIPVAPETLPPQLLRGKVLFNNASLPQLSHLGWISCASCHPDGGSDNTTWATPEGTRQTMPLWELDGTAPYHIAGSRDEIADFEHDIESLMDGFGLAPGAAQRLLGTPNGGRSDDLDALADFVLVGARVPAAPSGDPALIADGRELFVELGCQGCHGGPHWTASALHGPVGTLAPGGGLQVEAGLVDIGTFDPETDVLGEPGFDVPTLLGLHATAPYLHDGSAPSLRGVLASPRHVGRALDPDEVESLVAFLRSIDRSTPIVAP